jgi:hypothetical protein
MYRPSKTYIARWWTSLLLVCILVMSPWYSSTTFAAACVLGTSLNASAGSAGCDMLVTAQINPGALTLSDDAFATVSGSPYTIKKTAIIATFNFTSIVDDHRGSTAGWALKAASTGIAHASIVLPLSLTAKGFGTNCQNGTCTPTTFTPITLSGTATKFLQAGNGTTVVVDGDYTNKTDGQFTIPTGVPVGSYTGTITISLVSSF